MRPNPFENITNWLVLVFFFHSDPVRFHRFRRCLSPHSLIRWALPCSLSVTIIFLFYAFQMCIALCEFVRDQWTMWKLTTLTWRQYFFDVPMETGRMKKKTRLTCWRAVKSRLSERARKTRTHGVVVAVNLLLLLWPLLDLFSSSKCLMWRYA